MAARRRALAASRTSVERADLEAAIDEFIPSSEGLEKELQELAAVLECTDRNFLPPAWRAKIATAADRTRLQERMVAIRQPFRLVEAVMQHQERILSVRA